MMITKGAPHDHEDERGGTHGLKNEWEAPTVTRTSGGGTNSTTTTGGDPTTTRTSREAPTATLTHGDDNSGAGHQG